MTSDVWSPPEAPVVEVCLDDGSPGPGLLIDVWLSPRQTMRTVLDHGGRYGVFALGALGGVASLDLDEPIETEWMRWAMVGIVATAPLWGVLGLYVEAFIVWLSATFLGERVSTQHVAAAMAWGRAPMGISALPGVAVTLLWGFGLLPEPVATPLLLGGMAVAGLGWLWSWFTVSHALGEVLGRSAWRGLAVYLLPIIAFTSLMVLAFVGMSLR